MVEGAQLPGGPSQLVLVVQLPGGARVEVADEISKDAAFALTFVRKYRGSIRRFESFYGEEWNH